MSLSSSLERLALDLRHSLRVLARAPLFTAVALLSLGLGIGANTAIFTIVHAVMLKTLPVEEPGRLVQFAVGGRQTYMTNPIWEALRDRQQVFDGFFAFSRTRFDLASGGEKRLVEGMYVSGDFFETLGVPAVAGRVLTREDDRRGGGVHGPVAVLGYTYWRDAYRLSREAIGARIRLDGQVFTIVGVAPPGFFGASVGQRFDVAVPIASADLIRSKDSPLDRRTNWWLTLIGRLKPGMSREQAEAGLRAIQPQVREATAPADTNAGRPERLAGYMAEPVTLLPASTGPSYLRRQYETALLTLMGAVGLVLLIACANLANLMLARASARQKEFAVRLALGAPRARLVRQLLMESLLLAVGGAAFGLLFARWASELLVRQLARQGSVLFLDVSIDGTVLGFTMAAAALTALLFGLAPAFRSTDLGAHALLKGSARSIAAGWRGFTLEKGLVVVQVGLSLMLVFGAALFVRSFVSLTGQDPGFDRRHVTFVWVDARRANLPPERRADAYRRLLDALRAVPGVRAAAAVNITPISGSNSMDSVSVRGQGTRDVQGTVYMNRVGPGYFATMGTPVHAGREFTDQDTLDVPLVAIVNETFARKFLPGVNPIGRTFNLADEQDAPEMARIVGLVKDSRYVNMRAEVPPTVFMATGQEREPGNDPSFVVRGAGDAGNPGHAGDAAALARSLTAAARGVNAGFAMEFREMDTLVRDSVSQERLLAMLSGFFGVLALLVAGIGLYGVMSLAVSRRRQEIGIRMALGAQPASVVLMVLRDVAIVTAMGLAAGAVSGVMSGRYVRTLLFGLEPDDLTTWLLATTALAAAAGLAGWLPARRAAKLDPMHALREE